MTAGAVIPEWTQGDRMRKARQLTGMSTMEFAREIGVSQKTINNAESDSHVVRKIVMNAWALVTGVPVEWLQTGEVRHEGLEPPTRCLGVQVPMARRSADAA